ncbi:DUF899 family protein [Gemmata massiliana]|uniref:DUF899 family protein n=1 Tax=Gemmata massiliana TaxID=1210884 RepID=UPI0013A6B653
MKPGLPEVVDQATWQKHLDAITVKEKAVTKALDALGAERRRLPMVAGKRSQVTADACCRTSSGKLRPLCGSSEHLRLTASSSVSRSHYFLTGRTSPRHLASPGILCVYARNDGRLAWPPDTTSRSPSAPRTWSCTDGPRRRSPRTV